MTAIHTALPGLFTPMPVAMQLWLVAGVAILVYLRIGLR